MALLIAHRGSHQTEPENTLAAFAAGAAQGAEMVELDVRRTADGALAIVHDPEVGRAGIGTLGLDELRERAGVAVPTLEEVVAWATGAGMGLDVELKEDGYVDHALDALAGFDGRLLVTSFIDPVLGQLAAARPALERGLILTLTAMGAVRRAEQCGAQAVVVEMKLVTEKLLVELTGAGLTVYVWGFLPARAGHLEWIADPRIAGWITDDVPGTAAALGR